MAIAPSTWAFREGLPSSKHSRQTLEQTWPGRLIIQATGASQIIVGTGEWYFGWYLFNPAKQIHDRMRIQGQHNIGTLQYSLDGGATWNNSLLSAATTPATALVTAGDQPNGVTTAQLGFSTVDLSGILSTQWIGLRIQFGPGFLHFNIAAFIYNNQHNPF